MDANTRRKKLPTEEAKGLGAEKAAVAAAAAAAREQESEVPTWWPNAAIAGGGEGAEGRLNRAAPVGASPSDRGRSTHAGAATAARGSIRRRVSFQLHGETQEQQQQQRRGEEGLPEDSTSPAHHPSSGIPSSALPPVLLHVHGGGFVGSTFAGDLMVLSKWAQGKGVHSMPGQMEEGKGGAASGGGGGGGGGGPRLPQHHQQQPILIVYPHYSLAPEKQYPCQLHEILRVYSWLRSRTARMVVQGESAGGTIASAVLIKALQEGLPMPRGLLLAYPALNLNPQASPSRVLHMSDPLIPYQLLVRLAAEYVPDGRLMRGDCREEPLINPGVAPADILARLPTTNLIVGGLDPLLDDAVDFHAALRREGVPGVLHVARTLPHGFINFPLLAGAAEATERVRGWASSLLFES